jgi:hypothetical protein
MCIAPAWFTPVQTQLNNIQTHWQPELDNMQTVLNNMRGRVDTIEERLDENGTLLRTVVQNQAIVSMIVSYHWQNIYITFLLSC